MARSFAGSFGDLQASVSFAGTEAAYITRDHPPVGAEGQQLYPWTELDLLFFLFC